MSSDGQYDKLVSDACNNAGGALKIIREVFRARGDSEMAAVIEEMRTFLGGATKVVQLREKLAAIKAELDRTLKAAAKPPKQKK